MKKFLKFCLIAAVILILVGLILGVASTAAGGGKDVARMAENGELTFDGEFFDFSFLGAEVDFEDTFDFDGAEPLYDLEDVEVFDGSTEILSGDISRMELAVGNVTDFEIALGGGEFFIQGSEDGKFYLEAESAEKLQVYAEDETLHLKALRTKTNDVGMKMTLYIPADVSYDEMQLELGAGVFKLEVPLTLESFEGEVGAGQMIIDGLTCNTMDINVGAGEFLGESILVNDEAELKVGAGHIGLQGDVKGDLDVECSLGGAELTLAGAEIDFNYEIECAAGSVVAGTAEFSGLSSERSVDNGASKEMNLECAMGAIEVEFEE